MGAKKKSAKKVGGSPEEVETWLFCRHEKVRYVPTGTSRAKFNAADIGLLRFHKQNLGSEALATEIEIFAARLDLYLLGLGYAGRQMARLIIQNAVREPQKPMGDLLTAVEENYMP